MRPKKQVSLILKMMVAHLAGSILLAATFGGASIPLPRSAKCLAKIPKVTLNEI